LRLVGQRINRLFKKRHVIFILVVGLKMIGHIVSALERVVSIVSVLVLPETSSWVYWSVEELIGRERLFIDRLFLETSHRFIPKLIRKIQVRKEVLLLLRLLLVWLESGRRELGRDVGVVLLVGGVVLFEAGWSWGYGWRLLECIHLVHLIHIVVHIPAHLIFECRDRVLLDHVG